MRVTILDGHPAPDAAWTEYMAALLSRLEAGGATVEHLCLRELDLRPCTGCWGCWVKTPGECTVHDDSEVVCRSVMRSDFTLWASPLLMGFVSALLKGAMDKMIPLVHPYFEVVECEVHHRRRYARYPHLGLLLAPEPDLSTETNGAAVTITTQILERTALNLKSRLAFSELTTQQAPDEVASTILHDAVRLPALPAAPPATQGVTVTPPSGLLLLNGSPRGAKGNSPILLEQFGNGFANAKPGAPVETRHLIRLREQAASVDALVAAGEAGHAVVIGFPLYTDAMPGSVKAFFEALAPLAGRAKLPPLAFLIQCGFPETRHLRYLERYLEHVAHRLGTPYLGTMAKGGCEGVRMMTEVMNRRTFDTLHGLGAGLAQSGALDANLLRTFAGREAFPPAARPFMEAVVRIPVINGYWNAQMKKNGAFSRRFARPYAV